MKFIDLFAGIGDSINISHPNSETRRGRVGKQIANTLLTGREQAIVTDEFRIRKLTPRECWRLQGFPDWAFEKAAYGTPSTERGMTIEANEVHSEKA